MYLFKFSVYQIMVLFDHYHLLIFCDNSVTYSYIMRKKATTSKQFMIYSQVGQVDYVLWYYLNILLTGNTDVWTGYNMYCVSNICISRHDCDQKWKIKCKILKYQNYENLNYSKNIY